MLRFLFIFFEIFRFLLNFEDFCGNGSYFVIELLKGIIIRSFRVIIYIILKLSLAF